MVELRKRKTPAEPAAPPPPAKKANSVKSSASSQKGESSANGSATTKRTAISPGDTINHDDFGGEIETNEGEKVTLKKLVDESKSGIVIFTYPKASTPGCTTQACLFRDDFANLTSTGFAIYGLSRDSPKSNTTFKTKQKLPYTLLCDPKATLITAIGMKKAPSGTTRGVFVVSKEGKVELATPGGPAATVDAVREFIGAKKPDAIEEAAKNDGGEQMETAVEGAKTEASETGHANATNGNTAVAEVAAEVADSAEKLDGTPQA